MTVALLFDIDSTLTPPRQPITKEMTKILQRLRVPFHVAAGSHLELLEGQFFRPLYDFGFQGQFDAFISNGAIHYRCNYPERKPTGQAAPFRLDECLKQVSSFDLREYLGDQDYTFLIHTLEQTLELPEFSLPGHIQVLGERIVYRHSMVNCAPIGRAKKEESNEKSNRALFVQFDQDSGYRKKVINHLENKLARLVNAQSLRIMLGGQTSFDIGIEGQDKSKAVRTLLGSGVERVIFIGDALYKGGNDAVIREYVEARPSLSDRVQLIQVESDVQTRKELHDLGYVGDELTYRNTAL